MDKKGKEKKLILIVDDEANIRELVKEILEEQGGYKTLSASNGKEALELFLENKDKISIIMSDIKMPIMDGLEFLREVKAIDPAAVVIMISALNDIKSAINAMDRGAYTYITKPFKITELLIVVKRAIEKRKLLLENKRYQLHLEELVEERTKELEKAYKELDEIFNSTLITLVNALDARDTETEGHSERVTYYTLELAKLMGITDKKFLKTLKIAALLHDIGKIGIPDSILRKPGKLTEEEWQIMKQHSLLGYKIIKNIKQLNDVAQIVLHHHEKYDGSGYPVGLRGEEIPLGSRIFAVADTMDAMTSDRPYRKALTFEQTAEELKKWNGKQFDPQVVEAFFKKPIEEWKKLREQLRDNSLSTFEDLYFYDKHIEDK